MINIGLLLVGYLLGLFSMIALLLLIGAHRPDAPTLRRRNRDRAERRHLYSELVEGLDELARQREEVGGIRYEHLGMTGLEE